MLQLSSFPFRTLKTSPKVSDNRSTSLLLQGGYIRQAMAGAYEFLPMGTRVLKNIEQVVREEMDSAGYHEMLMTILTPREYWETTGRWEIPEYFKVPGWGNTEYRIAPTNEENVTPIMREFIQSYKDLPTCVYHIQKKFRNERRAKSGLLRGREFIMKDAYSFHANIEDFEEFYEDVKDVYMKVFTRLGIADDTVIADADGGAISDKNSHEFQTFLEVGEDTIYIDEETGENFNQEVAPVQVGTVFENSDEEIKEMIDVFGEGIVGVELLAQQLGIEVARTTKTMLFETDAGDVIAAAVRGDYNINEVKLRKAVGCKSLALLSAEKVRSITGAEVGYAGVLGLPKDVQVFWDVSCENRINMEMGANKTNYHTTNINFGRDLKTPDQFYDFKDAKPGDKNPATGNIYQIKKASEIGNIFHLGTKYSKPFKLSFLDKNNVNIDEVEMGCYGIGVSRLMGVMAEYFMTEKGIQWPEQIAPATHYIIVMGEQSLETAIKLAQELESQGKTVILDDRMGRKDGFGQKAGDCELFGVPNRIVISPKTLEQGGYELQIRGKEAKIIKL